MTLDEVMRIAVVVLAGAWVLVMLIGPRVSRKWLFTREKSFAPGSMVMLWAWILLAAFWTVFLSLQAGVTVALPVWWLYGHAMLLNVLVILARTNRVAAHRVILSGLAVSVAGFLFLIPVFSIGWPRGVGSIVVGLGLVAPFALISSAVVFFLAVKSRAGTHEKHKTADETEASRRPSHH